MKPRLSFFVLAEGVAFDQLTGRLTAFNVMDHVLVAQLPTMMARLVAISRYELADEPDTFIERVRLLAPSGDVRASSETPLELRPRTPHQSHRSVHILWRAVFEEPGDYRVVLERRGQGTEAWTEIASQRLAVMVDRNAVLNAPLPPVSVPPTT